MADFDEHAYATSLGATPVVDTMNTSPTMSAVHGAARGITLGLQSHIVGGIGAALAFLDPSDPAQTKMSIGDRLQFLKQNYTDIKSIAEKQDAAAQAANPGMYTGGEIAGNIPTLMAGGGAVSAAGKAIAKAAPEAVGAANTVINTAIPTIAKAAAPGANSVVTNTIAGGIQGGAENGDVGSGAAAGFATAGVLHGLGLIAGTIDKAILNHFGSGYTQKVQQQVTDKMFPNHYYDDLSDVQRAQVGTAADRQIENDAKNATPTAVKALLSTGVKAATGAATGYFANQAGITNIGGVDISPLLGLEVGGAYSVAHALPTVAKSYFDQRAAGDILKAETTGAELPGGQFGSLTNAALNAGFAPQARAELTQHNAPQPDFDETNFAQSLGATPQ